MHRKQMAAMFFGAVLAGMCVLVGSGLSVSNNPMPTTRVSREYGSPNAVFDAFVKANERQDWLTVFSCYTPTAQDDAVFEAFFSCQMQLENPQVVALLQRYKAEPKVIDMEYAKLYRTKHNVDLNEVGRATQKRVEELPKRSGNIHHYKGEERASPALESPAEYLGIFNDEDLLRQIVCSTIVDQAAFFRDVNTLLPEKGRQSTTEAILNCTIHGDMAVGRTKVTTYHLATIDSDAEKQVEQNICEIIHFRRIGGGWLIDAFEVEAAREPPKQP